ncbi:LysR substrate-binding domain-containing protein [Streptomyces polyrhachis]|uniref:LysR substrate-binding domain-containing protein n=1 Tax=Streptomyces polyrhachis TaxID=1282885 RepID=A0ABW2GJW4_9ACTN
MRSARCGAVNSTCRSPSCPCTPRAIPSRGGSAPPWRTSPATPCSFRRAPSGRAVRREAAATSRQELLTLVSGGAGMAVVGGQARRYHARPDIVYVPLTGLPPLEYGPIRPTGALTSRVRAFIELLRVSAQGDR